MSGTSAADTRVLVLAPTAKDFELLQTIFARLDIELLSCSNLKSACAELSVNGAGALIVSEEALAQSKPLADWLKVQPSWSDLPIVVLARPGIDSADVANATRLLGNVTILERPMRVASLVSAIQSALRARHRQYQIRGHLIEHTRSEAALRANDRRKDEFLAILAHELRNPLAPISNGLQILDLAAHPDPDTAAIGQMMQRQIANLKRLVDDLLEVSRVTRGDLELRMESVELGAIINASIESSQPFLATYKHRLDLSLPQQQIFLQADAVRLAQILSNLLNNAAKYTPQNGRISLSVDVADTAVAICVADNGVGIPIELQPKIFDMFMQVDPNRHTAQRGLGIGLTLVKRLVELHGGSVAVFSEGSDRGSRFTVRLPYSAALKPKAVSPATGIADLSHLTVLIADDNRDAADSLAMLIRRSAANVHVSYGGAEALAALALPQTQVAILDIGMDDIDGMEVARRIRARAGGAEIMLIALTGWGQQQDILNTKNAGFDYHFTKPVDVPRLLDLLATCPAR